MMQSPSAGLGVDGAPKVTGATVAAPLVQAVLFHTHLDAQVTFVEEDSSRWTEPKVLVLGVAAENKPFIVIRNIAASDDDSALIVDDNLWKQLIISQKNAMEARLELKRSLKLGGKKARELIFTSLAGAEEDFDLAFRRVQLAANSGKTGASAPSIGIDIDATANATAQLSLRAEKPELRKALKKQVVYEPHFVKLVDALCELILFLGRDKDTRGGVSRTEFRKFLVADIWQYVSSLVARTVQTTIVPTQPQAQAAVAAVAELLGVDPTAASPSPADSNPEAAAGNSGSLAAAEIASALNLVSGGAPTSRPGGAAAATGGHRDQAHGDVAATAAAAAAPGGGIATSPRAATMQPLPGQPPLPPGTPPAQAQAGVLPSPSSAAAAASSGAGTAYGTQRRPAAAATAPHGDHHQHQSQQQHHHQQLQQGYPSEGYHHEGSVAYHYGPPGPSPSAAAAAGWNPELRRDSFVTNNTENAGKYHSGHGGPQYARAGRPIEFEQQQQQQQRRSTQYDDRQGAGYFAAPPQPSPPGARDYYRQQPLPQQQQQWDRHARDDERDLVRTYGPRPMGGAQQQPQPQQQSAQYDTRRVAGRPQDLDLLVDTRDANRHRPTEYEYTMVSPAAAAAVASGNGGPQMLHQQHTAQSFVDAAAQQAMASWMVMQAQAGGVAAAAATPAGAMPLSPSGAVMGAPGAGQQQQVSMPIHQYAAMVAAQQQQQQQQGVGNMMLQQYLPYPVTMAATTTPSSNMGMQVGQQHPALQMAHVAQLPMQGLPAQYGYYQYALVSPQAAAVQAQAPYAPAAAAADESAVTGGQVAQ